MASGDQATLRQRFARYASAYTHDYSPYGNLAESTTKVAQNPVNLKKAMNRDSNFKCDLLIPEGAV